MPTSGTWLPSSAKPSPQPPVTDIPAFLAQLNAIPDWQQSMLVRNCPTFRPGVCQVAHLCWLTFSVVNNL